MCHLLLHGKFKVFDVKFSSVAGFSSMLFSRKIFAFLFPHMQLLVVGISEVLAKVVERSREYLSHFRRLTLESFC